MSTRSTGRSTSLSAVGEEDHHFRSDSAEVVVTALNDYNVVLQLRVWLLDERTRLAVRAVLRERLFEMLRDRDVDMPYQTLQVLTRAN